MSANLPEMNFTARVEAKSLSQKFQILWARALETVHGKINESGWFLLLLMTFFNIGWEWAIVRLLKIKTIYS